MASNFNYMDQPTPDETPSEDLLTEEPKPAATSSFFPFPLRSTIASTLRRISSDRLSSKSDTTSDNPRRTRPVRQESFGEFQEYTADGNLIDFDDSDPTKHHSYTPAPTFHTIRRPSPPPFQPPPLTPLTLNGTSNSSQVLTGQIAEEIRLLTPPRLQLVDRWKLAFSLERDGSSLSTLYDKCTNYDGKRGGFVLLVKDAMANVFGAYLSDPPYPSRGHYYGTGECFLWRCSVLPSLSSVSLASLPPPPSADTTHATRMTTIGPSESMSPTAGPLRVPWLNGISGGTSGTSTPERIRFTAFPYSGINDYMIFCEHSFLSVGGGDGHYGLWLDASLENGVSSSCPTFGNEPLSSEGTKFEVLGVEVWSIGA